MGIDIYINDEWVGRNIHSCMSRNNQILMDTFKDNNEVNEKELMLKIIALASYIEKNISDDNGDEREALFFFSYLIKENISRVVYNP